MLQKLTTNLLLPPPFSTTESRLHTTGVNSVSFMLPLLSSAGMLSLKTYFSKADA